MARKVDLVFRSVGERTAGLALELAKKHIRPDRVHVLENVRPFSETVRRMLEIEHDADVVVHMDADSLIFENMRPFLEWNAHPYVDCYVRDRFRGAIHCGVHICRIDVVRKMRELVPPKGDLAYVLRPESRMRNLAMRALGVSKVFKNFRILHDHFQSYASIFEKYALRELRSRTLKQDARLRAAMGGWGEETDFVVARAAVAHAAAAVPREADAETVDAYIRALPTLARDAIAHLDLPEQGALDTCEVDDRLAEVGWDGEPAARPKVFGLGLSRTGTRSLTAALHILGWDVVHYPTDEQTLAELADGNCRFSLLQHYDGITDITAAPFFADLDHAHPGSKFILTVRDKQSWLRSAENHWKGRPAFDDPTKDETHLRIRRLLRAATYGCYDFNPERFSRTYDRHVDAVSAYFRDRPDDLLTLDVVGGEGWERLAAFLSVPLPREPFPHKGGKLSKKLAQLEVQD